jgi:hypothetical protein
LSTPFCKILLIPLQKEKQSSPCRNACLIFKGSCQRADARIR